VLPPYSALNATQRPSGDSLGLIVSPWKLVSRRAFPPARSTTQTLLACVNAMCCALTLGMRSSRVVPAGAAADVCAASGCPDACAHRGATAGMTASAAAAARTEGRDMWDQWGTAYDGRRATSGARPTA
jgi:hypothetical protein